MNSQTFVQTPFQQNTRIVSCPVTNKALCIDPGEPSQEILDYLVDSGLDLSAMVFTHGHLDHIGGASALYSRFPSAEVLLHPDELDLYTSLPLQPIMMGIPKEHLRSLGLEYDPPPQITRFVSHGDIIEVGELRLEVRHCPGHTLGHIVLVAHDEKVVFTGDCLFSGTIGRTDLPGGDMGCLLDSIEKQIMSLEDDHAILCGHGPDTTVGHERISNPFLKGLIKSGL